MATRLPNAKIQAPCSGIRRFEIKQWLRNAGLPGPNAEQRVCYVLADRGHGNLPAEGRCASWSSMHSTLLVRARGLKGSRAGALALQSNLCLCLLLARGVPGSCAQPEPKTRTRFSRHLKNFYKCLADSICQPCLWD